MKYAERGTVHEYTERGAVHELKRSAVPVGYIFKTQSTPPQTSYFGRF
jgi:hypothetical protein